MIPVLKFIHPHVRYYLIVTLLSLITGGILLLLVSKVEGHLFVNSLHTSFLDFFFTYYTHVGGGTFVVVATIAISLLVWKRFGAAILVLGLTNLLFVAAITQSLKHLIFSDALRPVAFIGRKFLHTVPDVELHTSNSFPSGHTAAGFAFFAFVALLFGKKWWIQLAFGFAAILVGYSRIYLSQHFLEDAVLGGTLGLACFLFSYAIISNTKFGKSLKEFN